MLEHVERQRGQWHYGRELGEAAQAKAQRLIGEALGAGGVTEEQLKDWPKGHPFKIQLAAQLRAQTTVTVSWLAERLSMGTRGSLAHLLFQHAHAKSGAGPASQLGLGI